MATGDVTIFTAVSALDYLVGWATTDTMKLAILDNTTAPTAGTATPALGDFTEVGTGGTYVSGGTSLGTWGDMAAAGILDSTTNPSWAADGGNDADAYWGLIYNDTVAGDPALAFVDLGGPVDMSAVTLQVTWNASGIATVVLS